MPKRGRNGWKDREGNYLVVCESLAGYVLAWLCADDGDLGGTLGERPPLDEEGHKLHELAAAAGGEKTDDGWEWETERAARRALTMINTGMVSWEAGEKPWPSWAVEAKSAGWTPPKGWTP